MGARLSLIAAMADERVIGIENSLPWRLPADMKWFRQHTLGKPIIMGRKTYESFGAKPLPERVNIVVTRDKNYSSEGAVIVHDIEAAIAAAGDVAEVMVIGGASFYEQTIGLVERMYLTHVDAKIKGDAWFPKYDVQEWDVIEESKYSIDEKNSHTMCFQILSRK